MEERQATRWPSLSALPAGLLLCACLIVPALLVVFISFFKSSFAGIVWVPTLGNYRHLLTTSTDASLLGKSIWIGIEVTAIVLLLGYPMAYWVASRQSRHRHFYLLLILVPYWISYLIRTYAWYPILGTNGVLNSILLWLGILSAPSERFLFTQFSVVLGLIYVWFPFAVIPIYLALDRIDRSLLEASADLGAGRVETFWRVIFPLSASGTVGGGMLVFILTAGSYVTPKLLGGPSGLMFGEMIADQFGATFNWSYGACLAVAFTAIIAVVLLVVGRRIGLKEVFFGGEA
ncbi:MAG TPA: ABC transporter permease [Alphaproteobacteria bacterium]|nr:ABC transporter permease [Alphaproteobacteria bacterium]